MTKRGRPPRKLTWLKLYIGPHLLGTTREELTPAERSIWIDLVVLAGEANDDGWITPRVGSLPRILKAPLGLIERALKKCIEAEKITVKGDRIRVTNFKKYNPERWESQHYGAEKTISDNKTLSVELSTKGTRGDKEEIKKREDKEQDQKVDSDDVKPVFESLCQMISDLCGSRMNPVVVQEFEEYVQEMPGEWIEEAIRIASRNGVRNWGYVRAILDRWRQSGEMTLSRVEHDGFDPEKLSQMTDEEVKEYYTGGKYGDMVQH